MLREHVEGEFEINMGDKCCRGEDVEGKIPVYRQL